MKDKRLTVSKPSRLVLPTVLAGVWLLTATAPASDEDAVARGKRIAFAPTKGNCLACHHMDDGESPGDMGPPLVAIEARFPNKYILREHLWDPMENNPGSRMPPFGRHRILTEEEIDLIVEYIYTL